jgi:hypothetical protein
MADHRLGFTLGSHIRFGSLDFLYMGVDHDLVPLPPSMSVDLMSLSGSDERVRDLDPTDTKGECTSPSPIESLGSPANIGSIFESMIGLCLHANEAQAFGGVQPHGFDKVSTGPLSWPTPPR